MLVFFIIQVVRESVYDELLILEHGHPYFTFKDFEIEDSNCVWLNISLNFKLFWFVLQVSSVNLLIVVLAVNDKESRFLISSHGIRVFLIVYLEHIHILEPVDLVLVEVQLIVFDFLF